MHIRRSILIIFVGRSCSSCYIYSYTFCYSLFISRFLDFRSFHLHSCSLCFVFNGHLEQFYFSCVQLITLRKQFSLHNVLHVFKISYYLLSISKITHELNCKAKFFHDSVSFPGLSLGKTIGTLLDIVKDSTSLMTAPILLLSNKIVCCGIFV